MAYWAKVENNIVVDVIVAEREFVETLLGTWLETDLNTRGNVHYGEDGQPDGGTPLRKNFAGVGSGYDPVIDGFYSINPPGDIANWRLNLETLMWEFIGD